MQSFFFGGGGGGALKDHIVSQGGGQDGPKKDRMIFERSLTISCYPVIASKPRYTTLTQTYAELGTAQPQLVLVHVL